jgi:predicted Zn-dependent protease
MLEILQSTLEGDHRISAWSINAFHRNGYQIYTSLGKQEAIRSVTQKRWWITLQTLLKNSSGEQQIGQTGVEIVEGEKDIQARIDMAVEQARLHGIPPYTLPEPGADYPDFDDADAAIRNNPWDTLEQLEEHIRDAVSKEKHIETAASEFFLNHTAVHLINSNGLNLEMENSDVVWDICLLYNNGSTETEFWDVKKRAGTQYMDIHADIARFAQYARDAAVAKAPKSGTCPVVLTGDNLYILLQFFLHHSGAVAKYNDSSLFNPGKPVLRETPKGDVLNIASNPVHPGGTHSYRFDHEGFPGRRIQVIENGLLNRFWGSAQHAQYLGIEPTGAFGNIEIPAGTCSWDDLFQGSDRVILVHQFSTFDPQPVAGNYLGEIRVGYEYRADGSVIPLRGGSVTGNVVDGMVNCRFSRECDTFYGYFGPRGIRFERAQIAGD